MEINHQIPAHFSERDHRTRADDVERDLCRRARFQSCRSGQDFGTDPKINRKIDNYCSGGRVGR